MQKRWLSLVLCVLFVVSMFSICAFATDDDPGDVVYLDVNEVTESDNFEEITREEYIAHKAARLGISYDEAASMVDANIENALASMPAPMTWEPGGYEDNGDSTRTVYGRVSQVYTHKSNLKMIYYVEAVVIASHYGQTWAECDSTGGADPYGNGNFTFTGTTTARLTSNTKLRMACSGYFEIALSVAKDMGISAGLFSSSVSVGNTEYLRDNISTYMTETLHQSS